MHLDRRARGFTLIEAMIVVVIVGVLALIAIIGYRRWMHSTYVTEAFEMVTNIRAGEEAFRSENGGYLDVSTGLGPGYDYPAATPGKFKTAWGGNCTPCQTTTSWQALNIQPSGPLGFGYSVRNDIGLAGTPPTPSVNGVALATGAMTAPWYFIEADGDYDGNGTFTNVYGMSGTNRLFEQDEGE
jgi:type IV pilus assembly protein PilA